MEREERRATILAALAVALGAGTFGYTVASADDSGLGRVQEVTPAAAGSAGGQASCGAGGCGATKEPASK